VVAPANEQSAVSLSATIRRPLLIEQIEWDKKVPVWSINGTPSDCVRLALNVILEEKPDLIVSGINRGNNSGRNILYSGTVAAAIESVIHEIPAIAFSCHDFVNPNYHLVTKYIPLVAEYVLNHPLPRGTLLNVNFPSATHGTIKGFKMTRQGKEYWGENPEKRYHPVEGHSYYWLGAKLREFAEDEECDITWLNRGYVTAVPVHIEDLTDHQHLAKAKMSFEELFPET
jgi:5'-nucleotidase